MFSVDTPRQCYQSSTKYSSLDGFARSRTLKISTVDQLNLLSGNTNGEAQLLFVGE